MSPNKLGLGLDTLAVGVPRAVAGFWSCSGQLTLGNEFLHVEPAVAHVSVTTFSGVPAFCSSRILSSKSRIWRMRIFRHSRSNGSPIT